VRHPSRSAGTGWAKREDSRAQTEPRARDEGGALPPTPAADASSLAAYVPWLEQIALRLIRERASTDVLMCERLISDLKDLEDRAAAPPAAAPPAFATSPMASDVRFLLGGLRAILRAIGSGDLPLDAELRTELSELVRDVVEVVMTVDLSPAPARR
jgi:hypothetical protein